MRLKMAAKVKELFESWERWQIALAIGAPIALGVAGLWYYKRRQSHESVAKIGSNEVKQTSTEPKLLEKAQEAKNRGNKNFKAGKYDVAIECYTEAINICPENYKSDIATFYQNRAAAHDHLKNYTAIVADCDMAIRLNGRYIKAFMRRAKAHEKLGHLMDSLMDLTAVCILEGFKNTNNLQMADRILKELGKSQAEVAFQNHVATNPSNHFIRNYYKGFVNDPVIKWTPPPGHPDSSMRDGSSNTDTLKISDDLNNTQPVMEKDKDLKDDETNEETSVKKAYSSMPFHKARANLVRGDYTDIINLCNEELEDNDSPDRALALLLRGTFYLLRGELDKAKQDLDRIVDNDTPDKKIRVNALIKRGSLLMQLEKQTESLDDFATAVRIDPENCDVYHHRGQQNLVLDRIQDAQRDFDRCIQLDPTHALSHIQKCYGDYRESMIQQNPVQLQLAVKNFADVVKRFPDYPDGHMLYAQALADEMKYDEADDEFKAALNIDPENAQTIVHRALLNLQWKRDIEVVCDMIEQAIQVDPQCEFAYETLGTLKVQKGDLDAALELFDKAVVLCKSETEMAHIYSLKNAAIAQVRVATQLQIELPSVL